MKLIQMTCPDHPEATLEGYLLDADITLGQDVCRPAVIVCPGGGYVYCSPREGEPIALRYTAKGFHAFVLRYSTGFDAKEFAPWKEVDWAVKLLREHAEEWHIDPGKIAEPVRGATLIGKGYEVLRDIDMVGNNLKRAQGMCGSKSGSVPTDVGQPMIRVSSMTVGGRG